MNSGKDSPSEKLSIIPSSDFKSLSSVGRTPTFEDKNLTRDVLNMMKSLELSSNESKEIEQFVLNYIAFDPNHAGYLKENGAHIRRSLLLLHTVSKGIFLSSDNKINFIKLIIRNSHLSKVNESVNVLYDFLLQNMQFPHPEKIIQALLNYPEEALSLRKALYCLEAEGVGNPYPRSKQKLKDLLFEYPKQAEKFFDQF